MEETKNDSFLNWLEERLHRGLEGFTIPSRAKVVQEIESAEDKETILKVLNG